MSNGNFEQLNIKKLHSLGKFVIIKTSTANIKKHKSIYDAVKTIKEDYDLVKDKKIVIVTINNIIQKVYFNVEWERINDEVVFRIGKSENNSNHKELLGQKIPNAYLSRFKHLLSEYDFTQYDKNELYEYLKRYHRLNIDEVNMFFKLIDGYHDHIELKYIMIKKKGYNRFKISGILFIVFMMAVKNLIPTLIIKLLFNCPIDEITLVETAIDVLRDTFGHIMNIMKGNFKKGPIVFDEERELINEYSIVIDHINYAGLADYCKDNRC